MKVRFNGFDCVVRFDQYQRGGGTAIILADAKDGEEVAVATVNVAGYPLGKNQVLVKDYSENQGMLAALEQAGIVRATGEKVSSGFVEIPVCELLVTPEKQKSAPSRIPTRPKTRDIEPER